MTASCVCPAVVRRRGSRRSTTPELRVTAMLAAALACGGSEQSATLCEELGSVASETRRLEFGKLDAGTFVSFVEADALLVVNGFQGGMWTMPAVQFWNVSPNGHVSTSLALTDGTLLGTNEIDVRLKAVGEALLLDFVPVPVGTAPGSPPPEVADDKMAQLSLHYTDECLNVADHTMDRRLEVEGAAGTP